jgi:hypothetical protein
MLAISNRITSIPTILYPYSEHIFLTLPSERKVKHVSTPTRGLQIISNKKPSPPFGDEGQKSQYSRVKSATKYLLDKRWD